MPHTAFSRAFARPWPQTRRGLKLWFIAIVFAMKGVGYLAGDTSRATEDALRLVTDVWGVPLQVCGAIIVTLCLFAVFCAYCPHGRDKWGYMVLVGFTLGWAGCFFVSPLFLDGPTSALQGGFSYALIAAFLIVSADDPEPVLLNDGEDVR